jgi:hypothetical protein
MKRAGYSLPRLEAIEGTPGINAKIASQGTRSVIPTTESPPRSRLKNLACRQAEGALGESFELMPSSQKGAGLSIEGGKAARRLPQALIDSLTPTCAK